jgi:hypothetical protein
LDKPPPQEEAVFTLKKESIRETMTTIQERQDGRPPDLLQSVLELEKEWRNGQLFLSPEELAAVLVLQHSSIGQPAVAATTELNV